MLQILGRVVRKEDARLVLVYLLAGAITKSVKDLQDCVGII